MSEFLRVTYISRRPSIDRDLAVSEVWQILQVARRANPARDVTGALFANPSYFAQVLEGPVAGVEEQFARISVDRRHFDVVVLERAFVAERMFPTWSMGFSSLDVAASDKTDRLLEDAFGGPGDHFALKVRALIEESLAELPVS